MMSKRVSKTRTEVLGETAPALITKEDCDIVLQKILAHRKQTGTVVSYEIVPIENNSSTFGEYFNMNITYRLKNESRKIETSAFIKSLPYKESCVCEYLRAAEVKRKEALIYTQLLNELRKLSVKTWCPECYLEKHDVIVLQNIENLGYKTIRDTKRFLSKTEIKSILKGLACMHACSLVYELKNNLKISDLLKDVSHELRMCHRSGWFRAGYNVIIDVIRRYPAFLTNHIQAFIINDLPKLIMSAPTLGCSTGDLFRVLCHRDVWGGNVFFSRDFPHDGAIFVDFQMSRYAPPAVDVLTALYLNTRPYDRKSIEKECFKFYYDEFCNEVNNKGFTAANFLTYNSFLASIEEMSLYGATYNCLLATVERIPGDYLQKLKHEHPINFHRFLNEDRTSEVIKLMQENKDYHDYVIECINDLIALLLELQ